MYIVKISVIVVKTLWLQVRTIRISITRLYLKVVHYFTQTSTRIIVEIYSCTYCV